MYTVRHALQPFEQAFGDLVFDELAWRMGDRWCDAFRPNLEPNGFESDEMVANDPARHLVAARQVFTESDVIVFTLGLTEAWMSRSEGAVFPLAPGVVGADFDPNRYEFAKFDYPQVRIDLEAWLDRVRCVNETCRVLLTVSPVPLAATYEDQHVWKSTSNSKAMLLAVARDVARGRDAVDYFPSYEIITSPLAEGRYYADDLRSVREVGVAHVMRVFRTHYFRDSTPIGNTPPAPDGVEPSERVAQQVKASRVVCEEELLDKGAQPVPHHGTKSRVQDAQAHET